MTTLALHPSQESVLMEDVRLAHQRKALDLLISIRLHAFF